MRIIDLSEKDGASIRIEPFELEVLADIARFAADGLRGILPEPAISGDHQDLLSYYADTLAAFCEAAQMVTLPNDGPLAKRRAQRRGNGGAS